MKTEHTVSVSLEVFIDLGDFDGREITAQDILNAFGAGEYREPSDAEVRHFIKEGLDPEDIVRAGNVQTAQITNIQ